MSPRKLGFLVWGLLVGSALTLVSRPAHAQAWVGAKGSLDLSLDYNYAQSDQVIEDSGKTFPDAGTTYHQMTLSAEWVPLRHLAVDASLPLLAINYTGNKTMYVHAGGGSYDDGNTHWTLTDMRIGAHYQLVEHPFALSPIIAVSFPVEKYETVGNAVAGRHLVAAHLGVAIGKRLGDFYAHAMYQFSLVQTYDRTPETDKIGQNTSDASLTLGYLLFHDRLDVSIGGNLHLTHGGIDFSMFGSLPADDMLYHDPLLHENIALVGGGVAYQITQALAASLAARIFVWGINTQNASVVALGLTWSVK
jgi:hypothetical protein